MSTADPPFDAAPARTMGELLRFWSPLWGSWLLMGLEGPLLQIVLVRTVDPSLQEIGLAAWGAVLSLQILIESPVIMLLSTGTALAKDRAAFAALRRFTAGLCLVLSVVAVVCAIPAVWQAIGTRLFRISEEGARFGRPAMAILVPWTAAIGWRRLHQGLLIRQGMPRWITAGTVLRLSSSVLCAVLLAKSGGGGIVSVAGGLAAGVLAEAIFATWAARGAVRELPHSDPTSPDLTLPSILRFHAPLAATSLFSLLVPPLLLAGIGRMRDPTLHLAAWPVVYASLFVFKTAAFALPETVIAQWRRGIDHRLLLRFAVLVAAVSWIAFLGFSWSPLSSLYLGEVEGLEAGLVPVAVLGLHACALIVPLQTALQGLRGLLVAHGSTGRVVAAMSANLVTVAAVVAFGALQDGRGVVVAALAMTCAYAVECVFLWRRLRVRAAGPAAPRKPLP